MSSPNKQRGTRFESEVVDYLHEQGFAAVERKALHGNRDQGDLTGLPLWAVEIKTAKELRLSEYLDEVRVEMHNAKALFGAAIIKRRGKGAAGAYVLLPMEVLLKLLPHPERA